MRSPALIADTEEREKRSRGCTLAPPRHPKDSGDTVFSDFQTAAKDTSTMDVARDIVNKKMSADKIVKQWRNQHHNEIRSRNKSKQRELFEKRWGEYTTPPRHPKDSETSSVISMGSNATATSAYQKEQQITDHEPNMSEITTVHRPIITRYGADIPMKVLDNILMFDGKQGELNQFLSTIESYSTMYRIHKTDLVLLRSRGKVHEIIYSGGSKGGHEGCTPPLAQNFFIFMQFSGKIGQIIGWCPPFGVSAPSSGKSWIRH